MPVRFLIYVAITALTRLLISNVSHHNPPDMGVVPEAKVAQSCLPAIR